MFTVAVDVGGTFTDLTLMDDEGRIHAEGGIETPLHEEDVRAAVRQLKKWKVEAIAISTLWSPLNPAHEKRIAEIVRE